MNKFYLSGYVKRWHTEPTIRPQTLAEHSFGMLQLCLKTHPNPSKELLSAIICHDLHESLWADASFESKQENYKLKAIDNEFSEAFRKQERLDKYYLGGVEKIFLKYLDVLEAFYYLQNFGTCERSEEIKDNCESFCDELEDQLFNLGFEFRGF